MKFQLALAAMLALSTVAHAQPAAPDPAASSAPSQVPSQGDVTALPGVTVESKPALPTAPCRETDRACYAAVARELKTKFPDVYWKLAVKCMAEEMQEMRTHANPLVDGSATIAPPTPGGPGVAGDIQTQSVGERTFCAIAQSDAKPPPKTAKR